MYTIAAFYQFTPLADYAAHRAPLLALAEDQGLSGSILLAAEGVNGTIAGTRDGIDAMLAALRASASAMRPLMLTSPPPAAAAI